MMRIYEDFISYWECNESKYYKRYIHEKEDWIFWVTV